MKKFKEFLFLFVPLIVATILPIIIFVTNQIENAFMGNEQYLRLFSNDGIFWNAIVNTYSRAIALSVFVVLFIALLCRFIKYLKSRKVFYIFSVISSTVISFFSVYLNRTNYFG